MQSVNRRRHLQKKEGYSDVKNTLLVPGEVGACYLQKSQPGRGSSTVKSTLLKLENTLLCRMLGFSSILSN
jgi:hypothetical protein